MTTDKLSTLRALLAKAAPLPWGFDPCGQGEVQDKHGRALFDAAHRNSQTDALVNLELAVKAVNRLPELLAAMDALAAVEEWWLREGMHAFDGAPACMFMVRAALGHAKEAPHA